MLSLKQSVIKPAYEVFNSTLRLNLLKRRDKCLWIVTYHRILPTDDPRAALEEPGMMVDPDTFREHLRAFKEHFQIVKLEDWIAAAKDGGDLPRSALAVTFDDGWADNYEFGMPALIEYAVPATLFVVTDMIGTGRQFWPNRLIQLCTRLGNEFVCSTLPLLAKQESVQGKSEPEAHEVIAFLKQFPDHIVQEELAEFEEKHDISPPPLARDLLTWKQVQAMRDSGYVDIGSHTRNHTRLINGTPKETIIDEVVNSKAILEQTLGSKVSLFCYPNGDSCPFAQKTVSEHYSAGLTTQRGVNIGQSLVSFSALKRFSLHQGSCSTKTKLLSMLSRS